MPRSSHPICNWPKANVSFRNWPKGSVLEGEVCLPLLTGTPLRCRILFQRATGQRSTFFSTTGQGILFHNISLPTTGLFTPVIPGCSFHLATGQRFPFRFATGQRFRFCASGFPHLFSTLLVSSTGFSFGGQLAKGLGFGRLVSPHRGHKKPPAGAGGGKGGREEGTVREHGRVGRNTDRYPRFLLYLFPPESANRSG